MSKTSSSFSRSKKKLLFLLSALTISLFCVVMTVYPDSADAYPSFETELNLSKFSSPEEEWGDGIEAIIEEAYRECFKTYIIDGRVFTIRLPFAENNERGELVDDKLIVKGGGKADAENLWLEINDLLKSGDFQSYTAVLGDNREKLINFDLDSRSWSVSRDLLSVARMKADAYPGLPHQPFVYSDGKGINTTEIYNYIYCVGRLGIDCSGFVWQMLSSVAKRSGVNLSRTLAASLHAASTSSAPLYFGTWYFNTKKKEVLEVSDYIADLKPLDLILFRGENGEIVHSSVIQSINFESGIIRYLQSTDEAPADERGVHESFIIFNPKIPDLSLKDMSLVWTQKRNPPFMGELASSFINDGERYRAFPEYGGGKVVRIKALSGPLKLTKMKK